MASSPGTSEDRTGNKIQQPSAAADGGAGVSLSRGAAATAEVARCTELLLELLSDERLAGLPTHAEAAAAAAASRHTGPRPASGLAGGSVELAAHQWTPQVTACVWIKASSLENVRKCLNRCTVECARWRNSECHAAGCGHTACLPSACPSQSVGAG